MTEETKPTRNIVAETDVPFPIEQVWRAITDSEYIALWFMKNDLKPEFGHKFTFRSRPIERWDGEFQCQVLDVEENQKISYTWKGGHQELKGFGHFIDTMAIWTLTPNADGSTHVRFEHEGFDMSEEMDGCFEAMSKGSQSILRTLNKMMPDFVEEWATTNS
ncbi:Activator of Hsp90 ATPase 1 family protein [Beijerinckia indica subsp. indica ATCC 9039]|uniref:Activator of Hsp90 ATPase 1 family protein n=2 Tax=Beijerinckia TaxID=532 RepID=B2IK92_BEII9|nr:Activator of Hsp90 ATPase 1 family protein [Beijerinckia indica subsp. indica ATCC 9039]